MQEKEIFLSAVRDKEERALTQCVLTNTDFLDCASQLEATDLLRGRELSFCLFGGFDGAERRALFFFPQYLDIASGEEGCRYLAENPEECPITCLRFKKDKFSEASHRDYLGALMGLGIRREMLGDIIVRDDGCDIIAMKRIARYILENFEKAGRAALAGEEIPLSELIPEKEEKVQEVFVTVSSLRLDAVLAAAFSLSRGKAAAAVTQGTVFVNDRIAQKPDMPVKEGDKLVLRRSGKAIISSSGGVSAKGRQKLNILKYI